MNKALEAHVNKKISLSYFLKFLVQSQVSYTNPKWAILLSVCANSWSIISKVIEQKWQQIYLQHTSILFLSDRLMEPMFWIQTLQTYLPPMIQWWISINILHLHLSTFMTSVWLVWSNIILISFILSYIYCKIKMHYSALYRALNAIQCTISGAFSHLK